MQVRKELLSEIQAIIAASREVDEVKKKLEKRDTETESNQTGK